MDTADTGDSLALAWRPVDSQLGWVKQDVTVSSATGCATMLMHRMRAASKYNVHLVDTSSGSGRKIKGVDITTKPTGFTFFDEVFGVTNGTALPTWELITTTGSYQLANVTKEAFRGIFTLDSEGWVVWYYDSEAYTYVFDWASSSSGSKHMVLLHSHNDGESRRVALSSRIARWIVLCKIRLQRASFPPLYPYYPDAPYRTPYPWPSHLLIPRSATARRLQIPR